MDKPNEYLITVQGFAITEKQVAAYLPSNFRVIGKFQQYDETTVIGVAGYDVAGWTFEDYVQPRLASGNMWATKHVPV